MKQFSWLKLPKPFFVQAPMENVTDTVFRQIIAECGRPDVFYTEFTSTDGMLSSGKDKVGLRLQHTKAEQPLIAQIWGNNPESYKKVAKIIVDRDFDGIDINMGCPVNKIVSRYSCGGLINNPNLAKEIFLATKESVGKLPLSIKTRIGYAEIDIEGWISFILQLKPAALTIHLRTVAEMSKVPAHFDVLTEIVKLRDQISPCTVIIANGDIVSWQQGLEVYRKYCIDGIMIGRGIFHNLWVFNQHVRFENISQQQKLTMFIKHLQLFDKVWGESKHFDVMKKFYKVYVSGLPDASDFRMHLMKFHNAKDTIAIVQEKLMSLH